MAEFQQIEASWLPVSSLVCVAVTIVLLYSPLRKRAKYLIQADPLAAMDGASKTAATTVSFVPLTTYLHVHFRAKIERLLIRTSGVSKRLQPMADLEALAPNVIRVLGKNPGRMTLQGTNTYIVGTGPRRILIDSGGGSAQYVANMRRFCDVLCIEEITDLLVTHSHFDHIGGILRLKELFPRLRIWKHLPAIERPDLRMSNAQARAFGILPIQDGQEFSTEGAPTIRAVYTPGHCSDHMCFLLEEDAEDDGVVARTGDGDKHCALFAGDCILGEGSCAFESLGDLMASLERLRALAPRVIYPGHGPVVRRALQKIDEYIAHRLEREREILAVLQQASSSGGDGDGSGLSCYAIVRAIYTDLPLALRWEAMKAVRRHLVKLIGDGRVAPVNNTEGTQRFSLGPTKYRVIGRQSS